MGFPVTKIRHINVTINMVPSHPLYLLNKTDFHMDLFICWFCQTPFIALFLRSHFVTLKIVFPFLSDEI